VRSALSRDVKHVHVLGMRRALSAVVILQLAKPAKSVQQGQRRGCHSQTCRCWGASTKGSAVSRRSPAVPIEDTACLELVTQLRELCRRRRVEARVVARLGKGVLSCHGKRTRKNTSQNYSEAPQANPMEVESWHETSPQGCRPKASQRGGDRD